MGSFFNNELVLFLEFIAIVFVLYTPIHWGVYYFQKKIQKRRTPKYHNECSSNIDIQY